MARLGIIGAGNMGEAILRGILRAGTVSPHDVMLYDVNAAKCAQLQTELAVGIADSVQSLGAQCAMLLLAVKPDICASILRDERAAFVDKALISIVTGWSGERLAQQLPGSTRILHVMPNTPALVGEGMSVFEDGDTLSAAERDFARAVFLSIGRVTSVKPELFCAVTGVSGSGPAYAFIFLEALADGGVRAGLSRNKAYELAAQTMLGAAKMVLETKQHPGRLKDNVCSPGGTTIDAVAALEESGFRSAVLKAVEACVSKAKAMES